MARPCSAIYLLSRVGRRKAKLKEHAMRTSQNTAETINTIGIDVDKNTFHLVGLDKRGAIVLQQKVSGLPHQMLRVVNARTCAPTRASHGRSGRGRDPLRGGRTRPAGYTSTRDAARRR